MTARLKRSIVGRDVYDKVNEVMGTVLKEDGFNLVIEFSDKHTTYTRTVNAIAFRHNFQIIKDEGEEISTRIEESTKEPQSVKRTEVEKIPSGEKGCGRALSREFLHIVKNLANQDVEFCSRSNPTQYAIKYNGYVVFECKVRNKRLVVMAHSNSLSVQTKRYRRKEWSKSTNWTLRSEFVFTSMSQRPLMTSLIVDGLYYRQIVEVLERKD